jgi:hypothetical protein
MQRLTRKAVSSTVMNKVEGEELCEDRKEGEKKE